MEEWVHPTVFSGCYYYNYNTSVTQKFIVWHKKISLDTKMSGFTQEGKSEGFDSCHRPSNLAQIWSKSLIFQPVWPWNLMFDLKKKKKKNRAPLLYYIKHCVPFQIHRWIQTEVTVRKRSIWVKIGDFLFCVTLNFDGWPWKTIGHLFYTTSSFVHHFKSIGDLKLKLQSGNAQFGSKSAIFCPASPWNLMDDLGKQ